MLDLLNQRYGKLTVTEFVSKEGRYVYWKCKCDCGNYKIVKGENVMRRVVNDCCGCATESYRCLGEHCSLSVAHYYCDNCGDEFDKEDLFKWNDQDYCKECIINDVEEDLEKAYPLD